MRRSIYLFALLTLFVVGCSEQSSVLAPVNNVNTNEPNWIALPSGKGLQLNDTYTSFKTIDGGKGGSLSMQFSYVGGSFGVVSTQATIQFPKGAFSGSKYITMTVDDAICVLTFSPAMILLKGATLNVTYTGVNLAGIDPSNVKFAYLATDGSVQYAVNDGVVVDLATGKLQVKNAKIPHFSRYGFVN